MEATSLYLISLLPVLVDLSCLPGYDLKGKDFSIQKHSRTKKAFTTTHVDKCLKGSTKSICGEVSYNGTPAVHDRH